MVKKQQIMGIIKNSIKVKLQKSKSLHIQNDKKKWKLKMGQKRKKVWIKILKRYRVKVFKL